MDVCRALRCRRQEHVLGRGQAVDGGRVVLSKVVSVEASAIQILDLLPDDLDGTW